MARAPVSKTGGWGFESLHSCHQTKGFRGCWQERNRGLVPCWAYSPGLSF
jgi:hypothetical protein